MRSSKGNSRSQCSAAQGVQGKHRTVPVKSDPVNRREDGTRDLEVTTSVVISTMTTAVRSTPNLAVAPTQNTAPVFEFRCLYTHDLRKKKKIWHDGTLRFHTFNRRVMVYDDSKNHIGDAHWRESGHFQEGEELKLDKGVMVEVGEQIGHTETDLAPIILDKRRPENALSPPRAPPSNTYSSALRLPNTTSQARPKSLAAVLGTSQGPIGRARLPTTSPFEQRQVNVRQQPQSSSERPSKKPRMAVEKENVVYNLEPLGRTNPGMPRTSVKPKARREIMTPRIQTSKFLENPSRGSADSPLRLPANSPQLTDVERTKRRRESAAGKKEVHPARLLTGTSTEKVTQKSVETRKCTDSTPHQTLNHKSRERRPAAQTKGPIHAEAVRDSAVNARASSGRVTNKLRFSTEKPRRKLMYKNLLSHKQGQSESHTRSNSAEAQSQCRRTKKTVSKKSKDSDGGLPIEATVVDLVSEGECDSPPVVQTSIHRRPGVVLQEIPSPVNASEAIWRSPSPLFIHQSPSPQSLPATQKSAGEDFEPPQLVSPTQETVDGPRGISVRDPDRNALVEDAENEETLPIQREITKPTTIVEMPSTLTLLDQQLLRPSSLMKSPLEQPPPQISPNPKPLRRILSETDAHLQRHEAPFPSRFSPRGAGAQPQRIPTPRRHPSKSPAKIYRSISDTTHLVARSEFPAREPEVMVGAAAAVEAAGFDPWSEPEAYLLFDWWPPGREKPSFCCRG